MAPAPTYRPSGWAVALLGVPCVVLGLVTGPRAPATPAPPAASVAAGSAGTAGDPDDLEAPALGTILAQVRAGLGADSAVRAVRATSAPDGIRLTVSVAAYEGLVPTLWFTQLVTGAVGELARTDQETLDQVIAAARATVHRSRSAEGVDLALAAVRTGQRFHSPSAAALRRYYAEVAERSGLVLREVRILRPLETAVQLTFVVPDDLRPRWSIQDLQKMVVGTPPVVEGALIQLEDPRGRPLAHSTVAYRTGSTGHWFTPGAERRFSGRR